MKENFTQTERKMSQGLQPTTALQSELLPHVTNVL
jgi:hypothetical protein